ncbi:MAG: universal stress protein [Burkholderiaceae bacterium]|nr:universal stress protein [Burkholderiaceae bacterium]
MNILLAVDGSEHTKKMLAYLAAHEELLGTMHRYTAINVHAPLPARARAAVGKEVVEHYYSEEAEAVLEPVRKFMALQGIELKTLYQVGPIGETIAQVANAGPCDLLVMGSHGHSALATLVLGSVTMQVLAHSTVPVLVVR